MGRFFGIKIGRSKYYVLAANGNIWATSSVYELEVADFIESTIWRFDKLGNELERWVIPERAWHISSDGSGVSF